MEKGKLLSKGPKALEEAPPGEPVAIAAEQTPAAPAEPIAPEIPFDDFVKTDLRVGIIRTAERIPKADKLLKLSVDLWRGDPEDDRGGHRDGVHTGGAGRPARGGRGKPGAADNLWSRVPWAAPGRQRRAEGAHPGGCSRGVSTGHEGEIGVTNAAIEARLAKLQLLARNPRPRRGGSRSLRHAQRRPT